MNNKGQFSIIAALLVAVVLIAAVMTTYSAIRYSPLQDSPQVLSAIDETNLALKQILGFTVGYYGSVLKVTGNTSFARTLATNYLSSGLDNIADIRPEWGPSFNVTTLALNTNWFTNTSYSTGNIIIKYDLTGLGVYGVSYSASSRLDVIVSKSNSTSQAQLTILKDDDEPLINLGSRNFDFYRYDYEDSTWALINPTNITSYADGTYSIDLPSGVPGDSYLLQVEDSRGIIVTASSFSRYTAAIGWDGNYSTIPNENIVVELLQNGTMRWLGQNLNLTQPAKPIPPVAVKSIHVTQTIDGVDHEVPFQVEDWASEYRIPLGLTSNTTVFNNRQMIVFPMNKHVTEFTIWWDGSDEANQTPLAYTPNTCFTGDDPNNNRLTNGKINLQIGGFNINSEVVGTSTSSTANFMRINGENSVYGAGAAYVIHHGVVRDIVQQEAEWGKNRPGGGSDDGGAYGCPNLYANIVITLPANTNYYTYQLRLMFIDSAQSRVITDLSPIRLTVSPSSPQAMTENGTASGFPSVTTGSGTFYNYTEGSWTAHHWSQLISGSRGAGIMFTDNSNQKLYAFDSIAGSAVGALKVDTSSKTIELLPVARNSASFTYAFDVTWHGAVATFNNTTPIYTNSGTPTGLWILAEYPPSVTVTAET
jgi:hypothetical protein